MGISPLEKKVLVILGPTSTGKTDLALSLAKKFNGELVSCDSRQVYAGLDVGTGKLPGGDLRFKNKDLRIIAIEQNKKSVQYDKADYNFPIALVVGHETTGVSKEVLDICDQTVEIPLFGVNKSLNVVVSLGIVLFKVMEIKVIDNP